RKRVSELLVRQPLMIVHDFRLNQRHHYQTAAERNTADAQKDRGQSKQQSKLRSDRHSDSEHANRSQRGRLFTWLFSRILTLYWSTPLRRQVRANKTFFPVSSAL